MPLAAVTPIRIPDADRASAQAAETLQMLGHATGAGAIKPPTIGAIVLLNLIGSPILAGRAPDLLDSIRAAYILATGPSAITPVLPAVEARRLLDDLEDEAKSTPENYTLWLAARIRAAEGMAPLDQAALAWAAINIPDLTRLPGLLARLLSGSTAGARLIPSSGLADDSSKKNHSRRSGWLTKLCFWRNSSPAPAGTPSSGTSPSAPSSTSAPPNSATPAPQPPAAPTPPP